LNASSTGVSLGTWGDIDYLGGGTGGSGVADTFTFEETKWNQTFMAANESSWTATAADGIFGLAFSYVADAGTQTIVETMIQQGILDAPRFGIYQGTENNDTGNAAGDGVLTIGGSKEDKYVDGDLTWVPLERLNGEYQVWRSPLQTVTGSKKDQNGNISSTPTEFARAWGVFDTGGALMTVPPNEVNALYESIGWNYTAILKGDHFPLCTEFNSSWSFTFAFGEQKDETKTLTLTGDQWARPGFAYNSSLCWPPFEDGNTDGFFLFGSDFMSQFYTIFDFGAEEVVNYKPQVGFGALKKEYRMRA
jgi:saccharopepsin